MQRLTAILNACSDAMHRMHTEATSDWQADYCAVVDPVVVFEMVIAIKALVEHIDAKNADDTLLQAVKDWLSGDPESTSNLHQ